VVSEDSTAEVASSHPALDPDSAEWLRALGSGGAKREAAAARLHELLLWIARGEARRQRGRLRIDGPELDDIAHQAAADALLAITGKLSEFRGESRFTTWAYRFVVLEVAAKIGRHFWRARGGQLDAEDLDRLPDRSGLDPARESEWGELVVALRRALAEELTDRQRLVFIAIVLDDVPPDTLVSELGSNRNAIYKTLFDSRRKLRASLAAEGALP
jgi:RNA polymerase sigma-70 factor (ECF subfamily)